METERIVAQIGDIHAAINRYLVAALKSRGIEGLVPSHGAIFHHLFVHGEATMKDLARTAKRDKSTVTALVKKLVAAGYVETQASPDDQRSVLVRLTASGRALRPAFTAISREMLAKVWDGFAPEEKNALVCLLKKVEANFV